MCHLEIALIRVLRHIKRNTITSRLKIEVGCFTMLKELTKSSLYNITKSFSIVIIPSRPRSMKNLVLLLINARKSMK